MTIKNSYEKLCENLQDSTRRKSMALSIISIIYLLTLVSEFDVALCEDALESVVDNRVVN